MNATKNNVLISADSERCIGCGICVSVCPFTVLALKDGRPVLREGKGCLQCLHCAAACPQNAILHRGEPAVLQRDSLLGGEPAGNSFSASDPFKSREFSKDLRSHLMTRRSYRHFRSEPVSKELLTEALSIADFAPSAKNQHPANWIIVNDIKKAEDAMGLIVSFLKETGVSPEILSEYAGGNNVVMGTAPCLILGYCGQKALNPPQDTALALYSAELYLQSKGVGTCWAGYLTRLADASPALREYLGVPEGCHVTGALMAGYPEAEAYGAIPKRTKPSQIHWV